MNENQLIAIMAAILFADGTGGWGASDAVEAAFEIMATVPKVRRQRTEEEREIVRHAHGHGRLL